MDIVFLGTEEYNIAKNKVKNHEKLVFKPFHIDCKFWNSNDLTNLNKIKFYLLEMMEIEFDLLINIARLMSDKVYFVSSNEKLLDLELPITMS